MYYSIPDCMLTAMLLGICFGTVYEALRIVRKLLDITAVTFVCDIIFFVVSAFAVFLLSESLGNYVRIYTVIGYGAGIFVYINTVGRIFNHVESFIFGAIRRFFSTIGRFLRKIFSPVFSSIAHITSMGLVTIHDFFSKWQKNRKKDLKKSPDGCYNDVYMIDKYTSGENNHVIKAQVRKGSGSKA